MIYMYGGGWAFGGRGGDFSYLTDIGVQVISIDYRKGLTKYGYNPAPAEEMEKAIACGYWNNFRYDPRLKEEGKNPFILDSKEPNASYRDFILNEARYSSLTRSFPDRAEALFEKAAKVAEERYAELKKRAEG